MGKTEDKHGTIYSIQALRALAFLSIFMSHTGINYFYGIGKWGVSVFLILSGFMMTYCYYGKERIKEISFIKNVSFARNKIKKLYPLHVVTTFAMVFSMIICGNIESVKMLIIKLILNLLLVQEWFPISQRLINGVSWYLSVMVFLYFIFPWVLKYMERNYSINKAQKYIVFLYLFQILIGYLLYFVVSLLGLRYATGLEWPVYTFPPIRALDFIIGCNVGYLFLEKKYTGGYTGLELITCVLVIAGNLCHVMWRLNASVSDMQSRHPERWWTYSTVFTVSSCMLVYLFAENKGYITKILTNKFTLYLGNLVQYAFLIHFVVFRYIEIICRILFISDYTGLVQLTVGFVLTVFASQIWLQLFLRNEM